MSIKKICSTVLLYIVLFPSVAISQINTWTVYSSFSTINAIDFNDSKRFVATSGGVFVVNEQIIESKFTTVDGLHRLDPLSIYFHQSTSQLFIGYPDGVIDVIDTNNENFKSITDIKRSSEFNSKQIHDIEEFNNDLFIATDFGIVVISTNNLLVTNNYLKIGSFEQGIPILDIDITNDSILVATTVGLASANLNDNLLNPDAWMNHKLINEGNNQVDKLAVTESKYVAIANEALFKFDGTAWSNLNVSGISKPIDIKASDNEIAVADRNSVSLINENDLVRTIYSTNDYIIKNIAFDGDKLLIGTVSDGVIEIDLSTQQEVHYLPDGPYLNFFSELDYSDKTLLATATDEFPQSDPFNSIRGYYIFENMLWKNFNRNTSEELNNASFSTAYTALNSEFFYAIGSWGYGLVLHEKETDEIRVYNNQNSGFSGISADRNYVVISGIDDDSKNNIWAISYISDFPLNVYTQNSDSWSHFAPLPINSNALYFRLFIDSNDLLWIPLVDVANNGQGLLVVDPGSDITSDVDDTYRILNSDENKGNLPDNNITAIVEDKNGEVWIGTTRGIARVIFPDFIVSSNNPSEYRAQWLINSDTSATSRFLLRDVTVSTIAVNSANEKWIGSKNQGIWLVNEDGSAILSRYTKSNSPLLSDNIQDITIDDATGEVYISTDLGLISVTAIAKEPVNKMDELKIYPNPFVYEKHEQITIENLSDETTIRILGADGSVYNELKSRGGRVVWNVQATHGGQLSSGVYFVVAIDANNNEMGIGKLVIIR